MFINQCFICKNVYDSNPVLAYITTDYFEMHSCMCVYEICKYSQYSPKQELRRFSAKSPEFSMRCWLLHRPRKALCSCHRAGKCPTALHFLDAQEPVSELSSRAPRCCLGLSSSPVSLSHGDPPMPPPSLTCLLGPAGRSNHHLTPSGSFCLDFTRQDFAFYFAFGWEVRSHFVAIG